MFKEVKISEVAQFVNGFAFKPTDWENKGLKIIRIQNLTNPSKPFNRTTRKVPSKYIIQKSDILVSWSATIDVFEWDKEDALLNQHIFKIVFNEELVYKEYFKFALKQTIFELSKFAHGSTMKHVVKRDFENHKIPLPPIADQIRIATLFSQIKTLIQKRQESIDLLDDLVKSTFLEMFGDPVLDSNGTTKTRLGEKLKIKHGFAFKSNFFSTEGKYVLLTPGNFYEKGGYRDRGDKQKYFVGDFPQEYLLDKGELLVAMTEQAAGLLGSSILVPETNRFLHNQRLGLIVLKDKKLNKRFLHHLFNFQRIRQIIHSKATGTKVRHTSPTKIEDIQIYFPKEETQLEFEKVILKIESIKTKYETSLEELENLYGSLSQRAFRGELDLSGMQVEIPKIIVTEEKRIGIPKLEENRTLLPPPPFGKRVFNQKNRGILDTSNAKFTTSNKEQKLDLSPLKKWAPKLTWENVSVQQIADWIKEKYEGLYFNIEMLIRFLTEEMVTSLFYFSSNDIKKNPALDLSTDIKEFIFSSLIQEDSFLKLEQVFYDAEEENFTLEITEEDYELIKDRSKKEQSGIYFRIIE